MDFTTLVGLVAAFCTTVSYYPQLKKCWSTGSAGDLSMTMFLTLSAGVALWVVYGVLKSDLVIVMANVVSFALLSGILYFKLRERRTGKTAPPGRTPTSAAPRVAGRQ
ncbi:MAG: MtN3 and saliva related transrane protein [Alphaproteobacteria bacterium]|jgi:MtN3 and saliva related transmembrane protein|nr:MtN3 and saliva related transrane protein [Alphaproteobacteria bacterium]